MRWGIIGGVVLVLFFFSVAFAGLFDDNDGFGSYFSQDNPFTFNPSKSLKLKTPSLFGNQYTLRYWSLGNGEWGSITFKNNWFSSYNSKHGFDVGVLNPFGNSYTKFSARDGFDYVRVWDLGNNVKVYSFKYGEYDVFVWGNLVGIRKQGNTKYRWYWINDD